MKFKYISIFLILTMLAIPTLATEDHGYDKNNTVSIQNNTYIKELPQKQELEDFIAGENYTSYFTNIATLDATKNHPTWPHDIWSDPKGNFYVSFYYENKSSPVGYTSVYYDDCGRELPSKCKISFKLIEPYYGLNVTEDRNTERIILPNVSAQPNESISTQVISLTNETVTQVAKNNTMYPVSNYIATSEANNNSVKVENYGNDGTMNQQIAGGNIWNYIEFNVQNLYLYVTGK
jgi:hypothetical protein